MKRFLLIPLLCCGASSFAQDRLLTNDTVGAFMDSIDSSQRASPQESRSSSDTSRSGFGFGEVFDPFDIEEEEVESRPSPEAQRPTEKRREVLLSDTPALSDEQGLRPSSPLIKTDYKFVDMPIEVATRRIAKDVAQPVVLELSTRLIVSDDYSGKEPLDALKSLAGDYGLEMGVYQNTIYLFEPTTANRIARRIIHSRRDSELPDSGALSDSDAGFAETLAGMTEDTPERELTKEQIRRLQRIQAERERLLDERFGLSFR